MVIKMLVTDIDGTLLKHDCSAGKKTFETIEKIKNKGVKVVLASGRMFDGVFPVRNQFNLNTPVICYQGAMVRDESGILWQASVDVDIAWDVIKFLRNKKIHTNLYNNDKLYVEDDDKKIMGDYCNGRYVTYSAVKAFEELTLQNVSKLLAVLYDEDEMFKVQEELKERYCGKLTIVRSHKYYCEITSLQATKGHAAEFLMKHWGIKKEEVMAAGDQDNDYEMLKCAGLKIAMQNASTKLKKIADYICPPVNEEGLVYAMEKYIL
jgi:hypothetical protein